MRIILLLFILGSAVPVLSQNYSDIINLNYQWLKINPDDYDQKAFETGLKIKLPVHLNDEKRLFDFRRPFNPLQTYDLLVSGKRIQTEYC